MNYMKQVAEIFNLDLGEEFKIIGCHEYYRLSPDDVIEWKNNAGEWRKEELSIFFDILLGKCKIEKIPKNYDDKMINNNCLRCFYHESNLDDCPGKSEMCREFVNIEDFNKLGERAIPKKVVREYSRCYCPNCDRLIFPEYNAFNEMINNYCKYCGQALDW